MDVDGSGQITTKQKYRMFNKIKHASCVLYEQYVCKSILLISTQYRVWIPIGILSFSENGLREDLFKAMRGIIQCPEFKVEHPFRPHSLGIDAEETKIGGVE